MVFILIRLRHERNSVAIDVENDGPLLPEAMAGRLFDSMVSVRMSVENECSSRFRKESLHLGLGLYIVRLIMDFHSGKVTGMNRDSHDGVIFTLSFL